MNRPLGMHRRKGLFDGQKYSPKVFCERAVLKNFAKSTGKCLCQSLFFDKVAGWESDTCVFLYILWNLWGQLFYRTSTLAASRWYNWCMKWTYFKELFQLASLIFCSIILQSFWKKDANYSFIFQGMYEVRRSKPSKIWGWYRLEKSDLKIWKVNRKISIMDSIFYQRCSAIALRLYKKSASSLVFLCAFLGLFQASSASLSLCFVRHTSKCFLFSKTSSAQQVFPLPRRLQDVFVRPLPKKSSRRLQDFFQTSSQDVFKASSKTSSTCIFKTFSRCLLEDKKMLVSSRRLQDVYWKTKNIVIFKTSSRRLLEDKKVLCWTRLQDVFKTSAVDLHQDECLLGANFNSCECYSETN